jgi:preprotein translocase subunit SecG
MGLMESSLLVVHMLVAITVCGLVLLQHGKGADMGAAFGSGSSGSLFGASGSANFLSRTTAVLAAVFFLSSLGLTYLGSLHGKPRDVMQQGVMSDVPVPKAADTPSKGQESTTAPATAPAGGTAPAGAPSKAGEVPK